MLHINLENTRAEVDAINEEARIKVREKLRLTNTELSGQALIAGIGIPRRGAKPKVTKDGKKKSNLVHAEFEAFRHDIAQALYGGRSPTVMASKRGLPEMRDRAGNIKYKIYMKGRPEEEITPVRRNFLDFMGADEMGVYENCMARVATALKKRNVKRKPLALAIAIEIARHERQVCFNKHRIVPEDFKKVEDILEVEKRRAVLVSLAPPAPLAKEEAAAGSLKNLVLTPATAVFEKPAAPASRRPADQLTFAGMPPKPPKTRKSRKAAKENTPPTP